MKTVETMNFMQMNKGSTRLFLIFRLRPLSSVGNTIIKKNLKTLVLRRCPEDVRVFESYKALKYLRIIELWISVFVLLHGMRSFALK